MSTLSANTFRLVWTNATSSDDYGSNTFEVLGDRDSVWNLWYTLFYKSSLPTAPEIYSLDGRKQNPLDGLSSLCGSNEYVKFKDKTKK